MTIRWRSATVNRLGSAWAGSLELYATLTSGPEAGTEVKALAHPDLVGTPVPRDRCCSTSPPWPAARHRRLRAGRRPARPAARGPRRPAPDTSSRPRYTPLQTMVLGADDQESGHHELLADADDLGGTPRRGRRPALGAARRGGRHPRRRPGRARRLRHDRRRGRCPPRSPGGRGPAGGGLDRGLRHHGPGVRRGPGDRHRPHGLLTARLVAGADVVVVAQGPGNLGTARGGGSRGWRPGEALNAAAVLAGDPSRRCACPRQTPVPRHRGVSHHSLTAVGRVALAPVDVPVPDVAGAFHDGVREQARSLCGRHRYVEVSAAGPGRGAGHQPGAAVDDGPRARAGPASFLVAAAAGRHAASLLARRDETPGAARHRGPEESQITSRRRGRRRRSGSRRP